MTETGFLSGKKVVITGANGFIGSRLVKELLQRGASVTAFGRKASNLWRLNGVVENINWAYPDFNDFDQLSAELNRVQPDYIYHLATYYSVDNDVDASEIIDTNIKAGVLLVKAASQIDNLKLFIK